MAKNKPYYLETEKDNSSAPMSFEEFKASMNGSQGTTTDNSFDAVKPVDYSNVPKGLSFEEFSFAMQNGALDNFINQPTPVSNTPLIYDSQNTVKPNAPTVTLEELTSDREAKGKAWNDAERAYQEGIVSSDIGLPVDLNALAKAAADAKTAYEEADKAWSDYRDSSRISNDREAAYEDIIRIVEEKQAKGEPLTEDDIWGYNRAVQAINEDSDTKIGRYLDAFGGGFEGVGANILQGVSTVNDTINAIKGVDDAHASDELKEARANYETIKDKFNALFDKKGITQDEIDEASYALQEAYEAMMALEQRDAANMETWSRNTANALSERSNELIGAAHQNATTTEKLGAEVAQNIAEMTADAAVGKVAGIGTGGASKAAASASMFLRSFGASSAEARENGADVFGQFTGGLAGALNEWASEKISDVPGIYGGSLDDITRKLTNKFSSDKAGVIFWNLAFSSGGEALEEVITALDDPIIKRTYDHGKAIEYYYHDPKGQDELIEQAAHAALVASIVGSLGSFNSVNEAIYNWENSPEGKAAIAEAEKNGVPVEELEDKVAEVAEEQLEQSQPNETKAEQPSDKHDNNEPLTQYEESETVQDNSTDTLTPYEKKLASMSNKQVNGLIRDKVSFEEFMSEMGIEASIPSTMSERRAMVKDAIERINNRSLGTNLNTETPADVVADVTNPYRNQVKPQGDEVATQFEKTENNAPTEASEVTDENTQAEAETETTRETERLNSEPETNKKSPPPKTQNVAGNVANSAELTSLEKGIKAIESGIKRNEALLNAPGISESNRVKIEAELTQQRENLKNRIAERDALLQQNTTENVADTTTEVNEDTETETQVAEETTPTEKVIADETVTEETAPAEITTEQQTDVAENANTEISNEVNMEQEAEPNLKRSKTESHTLQNAAEVLGGTQEELYYPPITERQTLNEAVNRVASDMIGEMDTLINKEGWTAADLDTAMLINGKLMLDGIRTGDNTAQAEWAKVIRSRGTRGGQFLQAFKKWNRTGGAVSMDASERINQLIDEKKITRKEGKAIMDDVTRIAEQFDSITGNEKADAKNIRKLILEMNGIRGTGTFVESNFKKILRKETDMDYLREFALRQMMAMVSDVTNKATLGQQLKTWQVNSQLTRLGTFFRNIGGNVLFGIQDTLAQDAFGFALDRLVSKATGKKTVAFDKSWASSKARTNARKAMLRSILEVAGDVNMSGGGKYGNSSSRTNKMSGNKAQRFMSRWEQLLGYSLTTSDKTSRGQIEQSVIEGLTPENSGLTQEEINAIAERAADYRLFQNQDSAYKFSKGIHDMLNGLNRAIGIQNTEFGLGDLINPYPGVPANLAVKAFEYSPANAIKGGIQLYNLLHDAKTGKVNAVNQYDAVMNVARGLSGVPLLALLTLLAKKGVFKNFEDEDDYDVMAQNSAEGKSGVQINLSAMKRGLDNGSTEWKSGDELMSIGWLEPMNAFFAMASLMAEDESLDDYIGDFFSGALQGVLEMPVFGNIANLYDTARYSTADSIGETAKDMGIQFLGDAASGMIPAPISSAAKTADQHQRDTTGDTKAETALNKLMANIPGLRQRLDIKQTGYGEDKDYNADLGQRFLNNFVLPGAINTLEQSDVSSTVEALYEETGDANIYPDRKAENSFSYKNNKYELTAEEKRQYLETSGQLINDLYEQAMNSKPWDELSSEEQVDLLKDIKSYAETIAKREVVEGRGDKYTETTEMKTDDIVDMLLSKSIAKTANMGFNKDDDGKVAPIDYKMVDYLLENVYDKMSANDKEIFENSYGKTDEMSLGKRLYNIDAKTWYSVYAQYKEISDMDGLSASQKDSRLSAFIDGMNLQSYQKSYLKETLNYYSQVRGSTTTYDNFTANGVPSQYAIAYADEMKGKTVSQENVVKAIIKTIPKEYWEQAYDNYVKHEGDKSGWTKTWDQLYAKYGNV